MEFHERVRALRAKNGMTQKSLGERINVSAVTVQKWENGSKMPSMTAIISLAGALHVSADYMLGIASDRDLDESLLDKRERELICNYRELDACGKKAVDSLCTLERHRVDEEREARRRIRALPKFRMPSAAGAAAPFGDYDFDIIIADDNTPKGADYAVSIRGDSMEPYIHDGEMVYIKKEEEIDVGDVGIWCVDGAMICKQYYIDAFGNVTLASANPDRRDTNRYISVDSGSSVKCCGKVLMGSSVPLPKYLTDDV